MDHHDQPRVLQPSVSVPSYLQTITSMNSPGQFFVDWSEAPTLPSLQVSDGSVPLELYYLIPWRQSVLGSHRQSHNVRMCDSTFK